MAAQSNSVFLYLNPALGKLIAEQYRHSWNPNYNHVSYFKPHDVDWVLVSKKKKKHFCQVLGTQSKVNWRGTSGGASLTKGGIGRMEEAIGTQGSDLA